MKIYQLYESKQDTVGIIFGRFNPPHKGHRAAWELASKNDHWYVGTNANTIGAKDPLPFDVKVKAMEAIWPEVKSHIVQEQSWFTLASKVYDQFGKITLIVYTDEDWVTQGLVKYNGERGNHGMYDFVDILQRPTPRLSSATALRQAVLDGDRKAFEDAAGTSANTMIDGMPFFDLVAEYLLPYADKIAKKKKKIEA